MRLTCGIGIAEPPYFDSDMLTLEYQIAEPKHHRRVYEEISAQWLRTFAACTDLPHTLEPDTVKSLYLSVWGGRRYLLLVRPDDIDAGNWVAAMERLCCAAVPTPVSP